MTAVVDRRIRDLGRVVTGKTPPTEQLEYFDGDELFVSPKDLSRDSFYVEATQTRISERALDKFRGQVIPRDAVMFTSLSFAFGKMGLASKRCMTNQQINSVVVNDQHIAKFVYYLLRAYEPFIFSYNSGIDTPIVPKSVFENIPIQAPDKDTQRKIAAILCAYDDLIANNQRRIALLEGMAEEIYREWFVRRRVPAGIDEGGTCWVEKRFASVCEFRKGRTPDAISMDATEGLSPYLSVDVLDGNDVAAWVNARKNDVLASADDVVMLMDGARSGVVFRGAAGVVGSTAALIATAPINRPMVFEYLKAMREVIVWNNTGSAIPHANKDFINRMVLRVPVREQVLISFNQIYEPLFEQAQRLRQTNVLLRRTRDALLPRLISGKLKVDHLEIRLPPSMRAEAEAVA